MVLYGYDDRGYLVFNVFFRILAPSLTFSFSQRLEGLEELKQLKREKEELAARIRHLEMT